MRNDLTARIRLVISTVFCVLATISFLICVACQLFEMWILSFFYSFQIHIGILTAIGALAAIAALPRNYYAWALLLGTIATTGLAVYQVRIKDPVLTAEDLAAEPMFRVASFNMLGENFDGADRIVAQLREVDADVVFALEARPLRARLKELSDLYPYVLDCKVEDTTREGWELCETIMLSKYPILGGGDIRDLSYEGALRLLSAKMLIGGKRVRFVQAHLSKPYFDDRHCGETGNLVRYLRNYKGLLVVGGDFNSSILAPCMQRFMQRLKLKTGPREPATWPVALGRFGIPIDHIFARPRLFIQSTRRMEDNAGSNHFGIYSDVILK